MFIGDVYPSMHLGRECGQGCVNRDGGVDTHWTIGYALPKLVTEAGGTHPTGKHSCWFEANQVFSQKV